MGTYDYQRLVKQPADNELFAITFPTIPAGVSITACSITFLPVTTPALVVGTPTYSGNTAQVRISVGKDGVVYHGEVTVTTDDGDTIEGDIKLHVRER